MAEKESDGEMITETYTIPSHGLIYDVPVNPTVTLRSMTLRDERKRLNYHYTSSVEKDAALAKTIEDCIVGDGLGIPVMDLCYGDFKFLENKLRCVSLGNKHKIECTCPACGESSPYVINLDDAAVNELTSFDKSVDLTVTLPDSGHVIELYFETPNSVAHTVKDIEEERKLYEKNKRESEFSLQGWSLTYQLVNATKTVDGKHILSADLKDFYDKLSMKDCWEVLNAITDFNEKVGLGGFFEVHCNHCGNPMRIPFRNIGDIWKPAR